MDYNIYIKLTNGCNMKCSHCFNEIMGNHKMMSTSILIKSINWIKKFIQEHPSDKIIISLFGGEPMLYDLNKITHFIEALSNLNINWTITTNLMYELTPNHLQIFNQMSAIDVKPLIKTSFDYGDIRFKNESDKTLWIKNVQNLISNGFDVQPTICLTNYLIQNITPKEVFDFAQELGINKINFERITETGRAAENNVKPLNRETDLWICNAYDEYKKFNIKCPLFESIIQSINHIYLGCRERKCMEKVITINPNGTISACPNMANKSYGNLDRIDNSKKQDLIDFEKQQDLECLICPYYTYCNGDCCQLKFDTSGCPGFKKLYEKVLNE